MASLEEKAPPEEIEAGACLVLALVFKLDAIASIGSAAALLTSHQRGPVLRGINEGSRDSRVRPAPGPP
jgi:hypothetical protein